MPGKRNTRASRAIFEELKKGPATMPELVKRSGKEMKTVRNAIHWLTEDSVIHIVGYKKPRCGNVNDPVYAAGTVPTEETGATIKTAPPITAQESVKRNQYLNIMHALAGQPAYLTE